MRSGGPSIALIGMMGAGKSSVGRLLKRRTGLAVFDTDALVAAKLGLSIPAIFEKLGEPAFREAETEVLRGLTIKKPAIIVAGGGVILREENIQQLKSLAMVVWLEADAETLFERASRRGNRPLLRGENPRVTFTKLLQTRQPLYEGAADLRIETTALTHDEVVDRILNEVERRTPARA